MLTETTTALIEAAVEQYHNSLASLDDHNEALTDAERIVGVPADLIDAVVKMDAHLYQQESYMHQPCCGYVVHIADVTDPLNHLEHCEKYDR